LPPWLPRALRRIRRLAAAGHVRITYKAFCELQELGLEADDLVDVLACLSPGDSDGRLPSRFVDTWLYVFRPRLAGVEIYVKIALRDDCVVISSHEDQGPEEEGPEGGR